MTTKEAITKLDHMKEYLDPVDREAIGIVLAVAKRVETCAEEFAAKKAKPAGEAFVFRS